MSHTSLPTVDMPQDGSVTGPLSTLEFRSSSRSREQAGATATPPPDVSAQPLAIRDLRPAPLRELPDHVYDPVRQVAVDAEGRPLAPNLAKDWTSLEGTHTDGDGGDNETWSWEENN